MENRRCCSTSRPSLAQRIKDIISTYEKNVNFSYSPGRLEGPEKLCLLTKISRTKTPIDSSITPFYRTSFDGPRSLERPGSACTTYNRSVCPLRTISSCNPFAKSFTVCPGCSSRASSLFRQTKCPSVSSTNIEFSSARPGPNLQRYFSAKNICPGLRSIFPTYETKGSTPCSTRSKTPTTTSPPSCRKNGQTPISARNEISTPNDSPGSPRKLNICPSLPTPLMTCGRKTMRDAVDPPFSSLRLEREFTSRFVKVHTCSRRCPGDR